MKLTAEEWSVMMLALESLKNEIASDPTKHIQFVAGPTTVLNTIPRDEVVAICADLQKSFDGGRYSQKIIGPEFMPKKINEWPPIAEVQYVLKRLRPETKWTGSAALVTGTIFTEYCSLPPHKVERESDRGATYNKFDGDEWGLALDKHTFVFDDFKTLRDIVGWFRCSDSMRIQPETASTYEIIEVEHSFVLQPRGETKESPIFHDLAARLHRRGDG